MTGYAEHRALKTYQAPMRNAKQLRGRDGMSHYGVPLDLDVCLPGRQRLHRLTATARIVAENYVRAKELLTTLLQPLEQASSITVGVSFVQEQN